jgi:hypothetical protein
MVGLAQFLYRSSNDADCAVSIGNLCWSNLHEKFSALNGFCQKSTEFIGSVLSQAKQNSSSVQPDAYSAGRAMPHRESLYECDDTTALRAAQYVRMSTDYQIYSTENQKATIAAYAAQHGISIVRTYCDDGCSGVALTRRQGLKHLIRDAVSGSA